MDKQKIENEIRKARLNLERQVKTVEATRAIIEYWEAELKKMNK